MARPIKPKSQRLSCEIKVYCHRLELAEIQRRAARCTIRTTSYLRRCALGRRLPSPMPGRNLLARAQLWRVKSNATQIGRALDAGALAPLPKSLLMSLSERTERVRHRLACSRPALTERVPDLALPRPRVLKLRVTPSDYMRLTAMAKCAGLSVSALIRNKALGRRLPAYIPKLPPALFDALYAVQSEWNATAHGVNAGRLRHVDEGFFDRFNRLYDQVPEILV